MPTMLPTPTRGLPATFTPGPKETCPPPTNTKVTIKFADSVGDYGPQILNYFRATGDRAGLDEQIDKLGIHAPKWNETTREYEPGYFPDSVQFTEADLTGDQVKETIIILRQLDTYIGSGEDTAVFVVGCRENQYALLDGGKDFYLLGADPERSGVADIVDLNADGILEIIIWDTSHTNDAHADVYYAYNALEWNGNRFRSLFAPPNNPDQTLPIESLNQKLELLDVDGNGTIEMLFPNEYLPMCGDGPMRVTSDIYMWDGEFYQYAWTDPGTPEYSFQAAWAGDYYSEIGLYDRAEKSYHRAIEDQTLKPFVFTDYTCATSMYWPNNDPKNLLAYARFRLVELLAFLGKTQDAETALARLDKDFSGQFAGYQYAQLADAFWRAFQPNSDIDEACEAVREEAAKRPDEIFKPIFYGDDYPRPTIETICPFNSNMREN